MVLRHWLRRRSRERDPAQEEEDPKAPAIIPEEDQKHVSQSDTYTGARVLDSKNDADERKIQQIPASEPGTDKDQLARELLGEFAQFFAPGRLN